MGSQNILDTAMGCRVFVLCHEQDCVPCCKCIYKLCQLAAHNSTIVTTAAETVATVLFQVVNN